MRLFSGFELVAQQIQQALTLGTTSAFCNADMTVLKRRMQVGRGAKHGGVKTLGLEAIIQQVDAYTLDALMRCVDSHCMKQ